MSEPTTAFTAPAEPRSPWQRLYGSAHRLRRRWYTARARTLPRPVLSVGNLHWGGTGKTPLVAALAAHVRDSGAGLGGHRVAILSRGYGGSGRGIRWVSTFEQGPLLSPREAGDEPVLLARALPGVAVVVGADRYRAGLAALDSLSPPPDVFLLDDGFSHLALRRDLDLLAFPAADPFGGGRLPPSGRLREPLSSAARADAALLTGAGVCPEDARGLATALAGFGFRGAAFAAPAYFGAARHLDGSPLPAGTRVLLASGIARPAAFRAAAEAAGFEVAGQLVFPDHHAFPRASLRRIEAELAAAGARAVLVTEKDAVKLAGGALTAPLAELPMAAEPEPDFWAWLDGRLGSILARRDGAKDGR